MERLGRFHKRKIFYLPVRNTPFWNSSLPNRDWMALTIANAEDEELFASSTKFILDKHVCRIGCSGTLALQSKDFFEEEKSWMEVDASLNLSTPLMITAHLDLEDALYFLATKASSANYQIDKLVCIDYTRRTEKKHLLKFIENSTNKNQ